MTTKTKPKRASQPEPASKPQRATSTRTVELLEARDGTVVTLTMTETEAGIFALTAAAILPGVYHVRFIATGVTVRGAPFTREQMATAVVWQGGDDPYQPPRDSDEPDWCRLLECVLGGKTFSRELLERVKRAGIDVDSVRRCLKETCGPGRAPRGYQ